MKEFRNRLHKKYLFQYMCMYGYALNVEEGALALISWQSVPTKAPPTGGLLPEGLHRRGPSRGPHLRVPTRGPPSEPPNQGPQQT